MGIDSAARHRYTKKIQAADNDPRSLARSVRRGGIAYTGRRAQAEYRDKGKRCRYYVGFDCCDVGKPSCMLSAKGRKEGVDVRKEESEIKINRSS